MDCSCWSCMNDAIDGVLIEPRLPIFCHGFWDGFVLSEYQRAAIVEAVVNMLRYVLLQRLFEIGKHQIAAQHEIEWTWGPLTPNVLGQEFDRLPVFLSETERVLMLEESGFAPGWRQLFQAAEGIASPVGAF